ncbi:MAG: HAMP domain-containing protein [Pseudonocardiaceae bacterium]|nr:HAMP domain-containing protein [Pseudonocardiaceae bacterium]
MERRRLTARARLTTFYGLLFLISGTLLVGLIVTIVFSARPIGPAALGGRFVVLGGRDTVATAVAQARDDMHGRLVLGSGLAVGAMTVVAVGSGWVMAGRVLRPVRAVSSTARRLSERDLHERLPVRGPDDELTELAETFNDMLARLERAFTAQQLFTANASHELRGPIATQRALLDVTLANPATGEETTELAGKLREVLRRQERLVNGLFELASGQHGAQRHDPVSLDGMARDVLERWRPDAGGLQVLEELGPCTVSGDTVLIEILVDNLVRNAITHNVQPEPGGWLRVRTGDGAISVENSGPVVTAERLTQLAEPFRRGAADRTSRTAGAGLGLAIVDTVVKAHGGSLRLHARDGGGIKATASFR